MIFLEIVKKNIRLLARNKASAFILIAGPIIAIALVGFFFSGKSGYDLSIGYYASEKTELTQSFISSLEKSDFVVLEFSSEAECVEKIKSGVMHTCIIFPKGFEVSNSASPDLRFVVDYSRVNLVYKVIDSVSGILDSETREVSYSLTSTLIGGINATIAGLEEQEKAGSAISKRSDEVSEEVSEVSTAIDRLDFTPQVGSLQTLSYNVNMTNTSLVELKAQASKIVTFSLELLDEVDSKLDSNRSETLENELFALNTTMVSITNESDKRIALIYYSIGRLQEDFTDISRQAEKNEQLSSDAKDALQIASDDLAGLKSDIAVFAGSSSSLKSDLESIDITRADSIVSPINTKIEPVVLESSNLKSTFPFLVVLIIMFASLTIASTLVISEKSSKALFRNFTAPVHKPVHTAASFVTVLLIILAQAVVILLLSSFGLGISVGGNLFAVSLTVLAASFFFISLGMCIGKAFSSQEGAVMASLITGSVLLFLSNLVIPLETLAPGLSSVVRFNPFIVCSELLRKALIFGLGVGQLVGPLACLFLVSCVFLLGAFFSRSWIRRKKQDPESLMQEERAPEA